MSRYHNGKRRAWTDDDASWLLAMADEGISQIQIAKTLDRTISSVEGKLRLLRMDPILGPGLGRFEKPEAVESDDAKHLERISESNAGYGFPVVTPPLLAKLYGYESAGARKTEFWRPA